MKTADRLVREGVRGKITSVFTKPNTDWFGFILEEGKEKGDDIYFRVVSKKKNYFLNFESPVILLYFIKIFFKNDNQVDGHYSREKTYLFDIVERPKGRNAGKYCALNIKLIE